MVKKYRVRVDAERFIHNDLGSVAHHLKETFETKLDAGNKSGVALEMMATLVFIAFEVEAKVNFVGWKVFGDDWDERASLKKKINKLCARLRVANDWSVRPLATVGSLRDFRDTLAHGKPEIVDEEFDAEIEPNVWDALKSQWEHTVTRDFVALATEDVDTLWRTFLGSAGISPDETITHGGHSLTKLIEGRVA